MINTHLFLTQTYLEFSNIEKLVSYSFFELGGLVINNNIVKVDNQLIDRIFEKYRNSQQIMVFDSKITETESQKETFRKFLTSDVYIKYSKPTLLFLGDLTAYSDTLQEGMLKLLEEPPENMIIVLFAQNLSILKGTVVSRCQIHNLPIEVIFGNLNLKLLDSTKKLPAPRDVVQNLLSNLAITVDKPSEFERDEIDFWLWQIQTNLSFVYASSPSDSISTSIQKVLQARKYNSQNLQKKFAIGWLSS